jgi:Protein of unknown function (DUF1264)
MLKLFMAALCLLITGGASLAQEAAPAAKPTPADGHTIHVTAPHLIDGRVRGPFHHYCKVVTPDPFIECLLYKTEDPNAKLIGIEYIVAKTLTRDEKVVPPAIWKRVWHDHETEIATGNVKVLDLPPDKAKEVADTVAKTDGIIFSLWPEGAKLPTGRVSMGQMVGHSMPPGSSKKE